MLNSPRLVDYHPYGRLVALLAAVEGREKRVKELEKDWDTLGLSLGPGWCPRPSRASREKSGTGSTNASLGGHAHLRRLRGERRVRAIFAPWNRGLARGHSEEAERRQVTDTVWAHVKVQAMGLSTTEPRSSLQRSCTSKFAGSMSIHRTLLYLLSLCRLYGLPAVRCTTVVLHKPRLGHPEDAVDGLTAGRTRGDRALYSWHGGDRADT